ncbi:MAG: hypothetical protein Q8N99_06755 [Nanoarchaeota archaeon]|nr:hypothetical protein [Nanoarchaeota archaeon]
MAQIKPKIYSIEYPNEKILWEGKSTYIQFMRFLFMYIPTFVFFFIVLIVSGAEWILLTFAFITLLLFILILYSPASSSYYYFITTHRIIITTFNPRGGGWFASLEERSLFFSPNIKEKPALLNKELGKRKLMFPPRVNIETKLGEGYIVKIQLKKLFLDWFGRKSIILVTSVPKQRNILLNYLFGARNSPFILAGLENADKVYNIIKENLK